MKRTLQGAVQWTLRLMFHNFWWKVAFASHRSGVVGPGSERA